MYWHTCHNESFHSAIYQKFTQIKSEKYFYFQNSDFYFSNIEAETNKEKGFFLCGQVYSKESYKKVYLEEHFIKIKTSPEFLMESCWGDYLLFYENNGKLSILRAPTGRIPLYYAHLNQLGLTLLSDNLHQLTDIINSHFSQFFLISYNWEFFYFYLNFGNTQTIETSFKNIYEAPAGSLITIGSNETRIQFLWDIVKYSETKKEYDITSTLDLVNNTLFNKYENIFIDFSGGLDSTALLYSIHANKQSFQKIIAVNQYNPLVRSSNELEYAKIIAQKLNINLITVDTTDQLPFTPSRLSIKPNKPHPSLTHIKHEQNIAKIINSKSNSCSVNGHGGDHLFICPPDLSILTDLLLNHDFRVFQIRLREFATYYRCSIFRILKHIMLDLKRCVWHNGKHCTPYVVPWFKEADWSLFKSIETHPFYQKKLKLENPGKQNHLLRVFSGLETIAGEIRFSDKFMYYPFFTQPMIELALTIPTYHTFKGQYDRVPLREAIQRKFNTKHVWRKSKGETSGVMMLGLRENKDYIMSLCMEGRVANNFCINKNLLKRSIEYTLLGFPNYAWPLMHLISLEIFLEHWDLKC